jgi:hypothetical protein
LGSRHDERGGERHGDESIHRSVLELLFGRWISACMVTLKYRLANEGNLRRTPRIEFLYIDSTAGRSM